MSFHIDNDEIDYKMGEDMMIHFDPTPHRYTGIWKKPNATFYKPDNFSNANKIPDITTWAFYLILNEKAYRKLSKTLEPHGEFLPVNCEGYSYYLLNTLVIADTIDAVDHKKSEREIKDGVYMGLKKLSFKENNLKDNILFKTEYDYAPVFCTDEFKKIIDKEKLEGLVFRTDLEGAI